MREVRVGRPLRAACLGAVLALGAAACSGSGDKPLADEPTVGTSATAAAAPTEAPVPSPEDSAPASAVPAPSPSTSPTASAVASPTATPTPSPTRGPSASPTPSPSTSPRGAGGDTSPGGSAEREVDVRITGGRVSPPPSHVDVAKGTYVTLRVTSDVADELHVHGYDREVPLQAKVPAVLSFVADTSGSFDVETHESGLTLFQLRVR
ncbi:hypothetical protein [Motilibacter peucedani]|uniref:hypothetical protein n=1 Tax=Motilibacter peucedani TaxID=598650 RepID=UPI0011C372F5|nr:hypothetical protein [Motilibacter peucedani]